MFEPLRHWHEFYLLLGTAAAALVALQFVAVSVGVGYISAEKSQAARTYMTPVIVHFTAVLIASALALVPWHGPRSFAFVIGVASFLGTVYSAVLAARVLRDPGEHVELDDRLCHGIAPPVGYATGVVSAVMFQAGAADAPVVLAAALFLLLVVNIRNAWDSILFLVRKHTETHRSPQ